MATLTISWAPAVGSTGYHRIKYWNDATPYNVIVIDNVLGNSKEITGLDSAATYRGTVEAYCASGGYTTPISFTAIATVSGGGGSEGLTTAINGTNSANCSSGASGTITINSADTKKVQLSTVYFSTGVGPGATLSVSNATTGEILFSLSATPTSLYNAATALSTVALSGGTYNYNLSPVNCYNGSGTTSFSLVNP